MTQHSKIVPFEITEDNAITTALFMRDALEYIGGPASIEEVLRVLDAHPYVRIVPASREVVQRILNADVMIERAVRKGTWQLKSS